MSGKRAFPVAGIDIHSQYGGYFAAGLINQGDHCGNPRAPAVFIWPFNVFSPGVKNMAEAFRSFPVNLPGRRAVLGAVRFRVHIKENFAVSLASQKIYEARLLIHLTDPGKLLLEHLIIR